MHSLMLDSWPGSFPEPASPRAPGQTGLPPTPSAGQARSTLLLVIDTPLPLPLAPNPSERGHHPLPCLAAMRRAPSAFAFPPFSPSPTQPVLPSRAFPSVLALLLPGWLAPHSRCSCAPSPIPSASYFPFPPTPTSLHRTFLQHPPPFLLSRTTNHRTYPTLPSFLN
jgi:hypothetical protein